MKTKLLKTTIVYSYALYENICGPSGLVEKFNLIFEDYERAKEKKQVIIAEFIVWVWVIGIYYGGKYFINLKGSSNNGKLFIKVMKEFFVLFFSEDNEEWNQYRMSLYNYYMDNIEYAAQISEEEYKEDYNLGTNYSQRINQHMIKLFSYKMVRRAEPQFNDSLTSINTKEFNKFLKDYDAEVKIIFNKLIEIINEILDRSESYLKDPDYQKIDYCFNKIKDKQSIVELFEKFNTNL